MSDNKITKFTTKYDEFEADRVRFTQMEQNERSNGQYIGYVKYESPETGDEIHLNIQTPFIKMINYGIPTIGKYYEDDKARSFTKIPLDTTDPEAWDNP